MTKADFAVRLARLPEEAPTLVSFVYALQLHEHAFEPNRRTDDTVAQEYFDGLMKRVAEHEGRVFAAERNGKLIGWLIALVETLGLDVLPDERNVGYIVELFVASEARRKGVASALARAAEADFRARGG